MFLSVANAQKCFVYLKFILQKYFLRNFNLKRLLHNHKTKLLTVKTNILPAKTDLYVTKEMI